MYSSCVTQLDLVRSLSCCSRRCVINCLVLKSPASLPGSLCSPLQSPLRQEVGGKEAGANSRKSYLMTAFISPGCRHVRLFLSPGHTIETTHNNMGGARVIQGTGGHPKPTSASQISLTPTETMTKGLTPAPLPTPAVDPEK